MSAAVTKGQRTLTTLIHLFLAFLAPVYLLKVIPVSQWYQGVLPGDSRLNLWAMTWQWRVFLKQPFSVWDGNAFFPFKQTITGSDHLFTQVINGFPMYLFSNNPFLSYHFVLFSGYAIGGWGIYWLTKQLYHQKGPALASAVFYTIAIPRTVHAAAHLQLAYMAWLPWSIYFLYRLYRKPSVYLVAGLTVTSVLQ
ncbi:hypothetical protein K8T06_10655, partial [bacterium]|nr:hypothetical protein [bacterium]